MADITLNINQAFKEYKWYNSGNVPVEIQCGINRIEFPLDMKVNSDDIPQDLYVNAQIVCNQVPFHECPISTYFGTVDELKNQISWDDILSFPVKFRDLSSDAVLVLTVFSGEGTLFGGTTLRFFDENGSLKRGKQKLAFYFNRAGDPNVITTNNSTPASLHDVYSSFDYGFQMEKHLETYRRGNITSQNDNNNNSSKKRVDWLDRLTLARIEAAMSESSSVGSRTHTVEPSSNNASNNKESYFWGAIPEELDLLHFCYLVVELPNCPFPVLHEEKPYPAVPAFNPISETNDVAAGSFTVVGDIYVFSVVSASPSANQPNPAQFNPLSLCVVPDWDLENENLSEAQYRCLAHDTIRGTADPNIKPNTEEKQRIARIVENATDHLTDDDKDLLYKFRYVLTSDKRALVKLLLSINWNVESEVQELPVLLSQWKEKAPIDFSDALKMLGREKSFQNSTVRQYAVDALQSATDKELYTYLLQLVQALRYEPENEIKMNTPNADPSVAGITASVNVTSLNQSMRPGGAPGATSNKPGDADMLSPLATFLIKRSSNSPLLANSFFWFLKVETEDTQYRYLFGTVLESFMTKLRDGSGPQGALIHKQMAALDEYVANIIKCQQDAKEAAGNKDVKQAELRKLLGERRMDRIPSSVTSVPNPLNPSMKLVGMKTNTARMFKSAVYPCVLEFDVLQNAKKDNKLEKGNPHNKAGFGSNVWASTDRQVTQITSEEDLNDNTPEFGPISKIMFKCGDDLRQDQLIMQFMQLMDGLLKKVGLDLKLLTYNVLAVTQNDGIMEFVPDSHAFSAILKDYNGSVLAFLRKHNHDPHAEFEIAPAAMDTYVKSCAASCVVTYILGIGDRHLDNIMMTNVGQLFHIDFGFIFGQDPKPLPPPFRFTKEMVEGMGGYDSEHYGKFKNLCCQAYNWLRKSASLILNLLSLMGDAGIEDISVKSDLSKVISKVEEKFRLDLTDEMADQYFLGLINDSLNALAPRVMEVLHQIAVARR